MKSKKKSVLFLIAFFLIAFSLRFIHLEADPPKTLSTSMGYMGDPGGYVINARNKIVFGRWEMDMWNLMHISPLPHYLAYLVFFAFGAGVAQMNLIPAVFSCLILIFVYLILRQTLNKTFALLGAILLGLNFQFSMFSRIAVRVMPMLFFVVLAIYLLTKAWNRKNTYIFLAGIMCILSFAVKGTFLLILPSVLLGIFFYCFFKYQKKMKIPVSCIIFFCLGMAAVLVFWFFFFYFPHREMFLSYGTENYNWLIPQGFKEALKNFWGRPLFYFMNMPILTSLSSLYLVILFFRAFTRPQKISIANWISGFWLISNMIYYSVIYYRAARHFIPLILPITFLSISLLYELFNTKTIQKPNKKPLLFYFFLFFWFIFPLNSLVILKGRPVSLDEMQSKFFLILGISFALTFLTYLLFIFWPPKLKIPLSKMAKTAAISALVPASLIINIKPYMEWALFPRSDIRDISVDFGKAFDHMSIAGLLAPVISLENRHEAHPYYSDYINKGRDFIQKYKITHIFTTTYAVEKKYYEQDFPETMKDAKLLARYPLWKTFVELYEVNPPLQTKKSDSDVYEAETFFGKNGIPRFDKDASGKLAFLAERNNKDTYLELSDLEYPQGKYSVIFFIKGENKFSGSDRIARIDVVSTEKRKVFALKNLYGPDLLHPDTYQEFTLSFSLKKSEKITLRIHSAGKMNLWIDKVIINRL